MFLDNEFHNNVIKDEIFNIFSMAQKSYFGFVRLAYLYKYKRYNCVVTDDLSLNPIDGSKDNSFKLIQNKLSYLFTLNDLVTIIENAIANAPNFFSIPLKPKNPYNNQYFNKSTLYNIYFKMKNSVRILSQLFHCYFLEEFDEQKFSVKYEYFIRENSIKKYVFNSPCTTIHPNILTMLRSNYYTKKLLIHKDFPKDLITNIFRHFLYYYYIVNYFIKGTEIITNYKKILNYKFKKFYKYNKLFGRKIISFTKMNNKIIKNYVFNTKHLTFFEIPINDFSEIIDYDNGSDLDLESDDLDSDNDDLDSDDLDSDNLDSDDLDFDNLDFDNDLDSDNDDVNLIIL
jgi:hypothetical protein